ncbi:MAG: DivIVA domain-containing protein [Candidatus Tectomicrobia bacterium]|nr:DivIVA domain-containing protein [Candidatus Tectomicrobia bacterium]
MKIAPIDIRQQRFSVKFRGFDPQEVDTFLEMVADELEELSRENGRLKEETQRLKREVEDLRATETDVKKTLLAAQTLKEEFSANARKEAELILRDARAKANDILGSTKSAASEAHEELAALLRRKKQVILNMRSMLETHLHMLEAEEKTDPYPYAEAARKESGAARSGPGTGEPEPPRKGASKEGPAEAERRKADSSFPAFLPRDRADE